MAVGGPLAGCDPIGDLVESCASSRGHSISGHVARAVHQDTARSVLTSLTTRA